MIWQFQTSIQLGFVKAVFDTFFVYLAFGLMFLGLLWLHREKPNQPKKLTTLKIGQLDFSQEAETKSLLCVGAPGVGKSLTINRIAADTIKRGDKLLMTDSGGEVMAKMWKAGDLLLNPLDSRTVHWSPFAEMTSAVDADRLARSIIPSEPGKDEFWSTAAQNLVAGILQRLYERGEASNERLLYFLTIANETELKALVSGLPASRIFGTPNMLGSVLGVVGTRTTSFRYLYPDAGVDGFSVRKWVADETNTGTLWLPYREDQIASLKSLFSTILGEATNAALSLRPSTVRRFWVIADEFSALGKIDGLPESLARGRKFGLRSVLGLQSIAQLEKIYGKNETQELLGCIGNWLVLRAPDAETAKYFSDALGEQEIEESQTSTSQSRNGEKSTSTSLKKTIKKTVLPSEISSLRERIGLLRLSTNPQNIFEIQIPLIELGAEKITPFLPKQ